MEIQTIPSNISPTRVKAILDRTIGEIQKQGFLPESPCAFSDGRKVLCAGALIVREAIAQIHSQEEANFFEEKLFLSNDKTVIVETATKTGFPTPLVRDAIIMNDSLDQTIRVSSLIEHITTLRDKVECAV